MNELVFQIPHLRAFYEGGGDPEELCLEALRRARNGPENIWITLLDETKLRGYLNDLHARAGKLASSADERLFSAFPLYGIPFGIKDNIDLAGVPTTAGCPAYAYTPGRSAFVVERLLAGGAIPLGKTHLDQFATGLVGVRSPLGPCTNPFAEDRIAGGSSSGSAAATARGQIAFALGTDTAGSGRIPAAFQNLIGLKPSRGLLSARGVVPACRSLDCVSIFAHTAEDARTVWLHARAFDPEDPFAIAGERKPEAREKEPPPFEQKTGRFRDESGVFVFGAPPEEQLSLDEMWLPLWRATLARLESLGGRRVVLDFAPFREAAELLYGGPWLAERYAAVGAFIEAHPEEVFPITHDIILAGKRPTAADAFRALYRLAELRRKTDAQLDALDFALVPTAPRLPTVAEVSADSAGAVNAELGTYTNFMNLLDCAAVATPAGFDADGLPFGVTLFAPAGRDAALLDFAARLHAAHASARTDAAKPATGKGESAMDTGASRGSLEIVVCGAHMDGMALNHQLKERGASLVRRTRTAPAYGFYALEGDGVARPGLIRQTEGGAAIEVEVWSLPAERWGDFVNGIPAPLCIGSVLLEDGTCVRGFLCEVYAAAGAREITLLGSWRRYVEEEGA